MELKQFSYQFEDLGIDISSIDKFMGYEEGDCPEPVLDIISSMIKTAPDYCNIKGGYVIPDHLKIDKEKQKVHLNDIEFDTHKIITSQLRKSESASLFVCTAGQGIGDYSKELMAKGELLEGYVADVIGSVTVELAMDQIQEELAKESKEGGLGISDRYSPGYCGWSVSEQHKLFSFFPDKFCGITLTPSSLMNPIKSVSGIIGIGKELSRKGYTCNFCTMPNCIYRKKEYHERKKD